MSSLIAVSMPESSLQQIFPTATIMRASTMSTIFIKGLCLLLLVFQAVASGTALTTVNPNSTVLECVSRDPVMDPTYEIRYGVDVVWDIPPTPKAVLFLAHGGAMDALSYFDHGPNCEQCYGLPEQRTVVVEALRRGYAVISVKSLGERYDTQWPIDESEDLVIVTNIIRDWTREHSLDGVPLAAWGHSAGTFLGAALPQKIPIQALILMCGDGIIEVFETATPVQFPPVLFAYMPLDFDDAEFNITGKDANCMAILRERGVPVTETQCWPKPLSPLYFTERILCMSGEMSRKIFAAYEAAGWLDSEGYLKINPSVTTDWKAVLLDALPFCSGIEDPCRLLHVEQELKSAFALHSFTSDADDVIFPWLDSVLLSSPGQALDAAI